MEGAQDNSRPPYRTIGAVVVLACLQLLAGWFAGMHPGEFTAKMFDTYSWSSLGYATLLTAKTVAELAAGGTGVKGIFRALMTDSKPGEPAPTTGAS